MASPAASETYATEQPKKITFRFCRECANMLYPKEDRLNNTLMFACRTCHYSEQATSSCVYRNELSNTVGETAGITQDVGSDPTVGDSEDSFYDNADPMPVCTMCGQEIVCEMCGEAEIEGLCLEVDDPHGNLMNMEDPESSDDDLHSPMAIDDDERQQDTTAIEQAMSELPRNRGCVLPVPTENGRNRDVVAMSGSSGSGLGEFE